MRNTPFVPGQYYHVYNRGNAKETVFFEQDTYRFFVQRLRQGAKTRGVALLGYCLMPNHFHLILGETSAPSISSLMLSLQTSYAKAINRRTGRVGHVFQGSFKSKIIDTTEYLVHLSRYVHLNPVLAGLVRKPEAWEFSSYPDYLRPCQGSLTETSTILEGFDGSLGYRRFVMDYKDPSGIEDLILEEEESQGRR